MRERHASGAIEHEVAAQLQHIRALGRQLGHPPTEDQLQEAPHDSGPKEAADGRGAKSQCLISTAFRVGDHGERLRVFLQKRRDLCRRREADDDDRAAEMRPAGNSRQMPQKDEQDRPASKIAQRDFLAVRPKKREIRARGIYHRDLHQRRRCEYSHGFDAKCHVKRIFDDDARRIAFITDELCMIFSYVYKKKFKCIESIKNK
jgi:hypothetical protein